MGGLERKNEELDAIRLPVKFSEPSRQRKQNREASRGQRCHHLRLEAADQSPRRSTNEPPDHPSDILLGQV